MRCAAIVFMFLAVQANAQAIQTGEHANFTRFVLTIPSNTQWELGRVPQGYAFRSDPPITFDLSDVFRLIPRDRVTEVETSPGDLILFSDCDCYLDAFPINSVQLVIDVIDGPAPEAGFFELSFDETGSTTADAQEDAQLVQVTRETIELPVVFPLTNVSDDRLFETTVPVSETMGPLISAEPNQDSLRPVILESISRGAAQGMVDAVTPTIDLPDPLQELQSVDAEPAPIDLPEDTLPIRTLTAIEREQAEITGPQSNIGAACIPDDRVDVHGWLGSGDVWDEISQRKAGLYDERDEVDLNAAQALARLYIALGFGAEARSILDLSPEIPDQGLLYLLSYAAEGTQTESAALSSQMECDSAIAMWALVTGADATPDLALNTAPILRAFSFLPVHLKETVVRPLADQLRLAGDLEAARQVLRVAGLEIEEPAPDQLIAEASIRAETGDFDGANEALRIAANDPVRANAEALAALMEVRLQEGQPISEETLILAQAMAFELGGTELAVRLKTAEFRGYLAGGQLDIARDLLIAAEPQMADLWTELAIAYTEKAPLPDFLRFSATLSADQLSSEGRHAVAKRLIDVGLPGLARPHLEEVLDGAAELERRYLSAEIAALEGDVAATILILLDLQTDRALQLRVLAAERSGDPSAVVAAARLTEAGASDEQFWRAGEWDVLGDDDASAFQDAARIMSARRFGESTGSDPAPEVPTFTSLEERRELLVSSQSTRQTLTAILEQFPSLEQTN